MPTLHPSILSSLILCAPVLAQTWTQLSPAAAPTARRAAGADFSILNVGVLLYGGLQSGNVNQSDTWLFQAGNWTQLTPATTPPARWGHRLVYDSRRARLVTFGGRSPTLTAVANDTWEWDGNDWLQVNTPNSPNPRAFYSMTFDERRGVCVLYGTQSGSTFAGGDQTWEYDGNDWQQITTATTPPGLETPAMTYDHGRGVTVMFGGWNGQSPGTLYDTTWEYDGVDWTQVNTPTRPSPRYRAACTYDRTRGRTVVYGGFGSGTALQDTWEYDGNDWTQVATSGPAISTESMMAFDPLTQSHIHFGGSGPGGISTQTWEYAGASTAIAAPFGQGCAGSAGVPDLQPATTPVLGSSYDLTLANVPLSSPLVFFVHGFSNVQSARNRL